MNRNRLEAWLSQFEDSLKKDALQLFLNLCFLDRSKFVQTIKKAVTELKKNAPDCENIFVAPLTTSGDFMKYYSADVVIDGVNFQSFPSVSEAATAAKTDTKGALLIVDDVIGSGVSFAFGSGSRQSTRMPTSHSSLRRLLWSL